MTSSEFVPERPPNAPSGPRCVDRGGFRFVSQVTGVQDAGPAPLDWVERAEWPASSQAETIYTTLAHSMSGSGGLDGMCRQHIYQQDKRFYPAFERVRLAQEPTMPTPSSGIGVDLLGNDASRAYEVEGIGLSASGVNRYGMPRPLSTSTIGASASHYTQALVVGPYIFTAGMIAINPDTARSIGGFEDVPDEGRWLATGRTHPDSRTGPVAAQTWSLYRRIFSMLEESGVDPSQILSSTVFLHDAGDTADLLRVHQHMFDGIAPGPALQVVIVDEVGHRGTVVEIEVTATSNDANSITFVADECAGNPPAVVRCGEMAFTSDVLPLTTDGRVVRALTDLRPYLPDSVQQHVSVLGEPLVAQLTAVIDRIVAAVEAADIPTDTLGQLYLRARNPVHVSAVARAAETLLGTSEVAITVLGASATGQCPDADVVGSAVCAGLPAL